VTTDWIVAGRPGAFTPTHVMVHHTAGPDSSPAPSRSVVRTGRPDLSGPLCNVLVRRDNKAEIVSRGRANHAGAGVWSGIPRDQGNQYAVGIEIEHEGTDAEPWTSEYMAFCRLVAAACLDHIGVTASKLVAHKEYAPDRKIDPWKWNMGSERDKVAQLLAAGPKPPTPKGNLTDMFIAWFDNVPYLVTPLGKRRLSVAAKDELKNETRAAGAEIMDIGAVSSGLLSEFPTFEETGVFAGQSYNDVQAALAGVTQLRADVANVNGKVDQILAALPPANGA
jgi:hypothetical protein